MAEASAGNGTEIVATRRVIDLLGGKSVLRLDVRRPLDAHDLVRRGLPNKALMHLVGRLRRLSRPDTFEKSFGMSLRTFQRHKVTPARRLSPEQSACAWTLAEILAKASAVFGSEDEAEQWLLRPAMGLDGRQPIDLLATPSGVKLVEDFLIRLEHGVYT